MLNKTSPLLAIRRRVPSCGYTLPAAEYGDDLPHYHLPQGTWCKLLGSSEPEAQLPSATLLRAQLLYDLARYEQPECILHLDDGERDAGKRDTAAVLIRALTDNQRGRFISVKAPSAMAPPHDAFDTAVVPRNRLAFVEQPAGTPLAELRNSGIRSQLIVLHLTADEDARNVLRHLDAVLDTGGLLVIDQANGIVLPPAAEQLLAEAGYHSVYPDRTHKERPARRSWQHLLQWFATHFIPHRRDPQVVQLPRATTNGAPMLVLRNIRAC